MRIELVAESRGQTLIQLWQDACADASYDECEPWEGFLAPPKKEDFANSPGGNRELPEEWQKWLDKMRSEMGKDQH